MKNQRFHRSRYIDGVQTSFIFIKKFDLPVAAARRPTSELVIINNNRLINNNNCRMVIINNNNYSPINNN